MNSNPTSPAHEDSLIRDDGGGISGTEVNDRALGIGVFGMDESWIKLHRKLIDHWVYTRPEYLSIWVYILIRANWKDTKAIVGGRIRVIERGDVLTSIQALAEGSHTSVQTVRTFLKLAQEDGMIQLVPNTAATHIKVLNYNRLQEVPTASQQASNTAATSGQQAVNNIIRREEVKKGKKEESSASHRARPLNSSETIAYFAELGMPADEAQRFTDYYTANGWKVGRNPMKDWKAAARNWRKGYADKQSKQGDTTARTQPTGLPAHVIEIVNRPKLSQSAVDALKQVYLSKVSPDE